MSAPFVCDTISIGLRTSEIASGKDVVSSHPHGQYPNRVGLWLEEVPWRRVPYPSVGAVIQVTWFLSQTLGAKAQPSTTKHGRAQILIVGSISRSVTEIST
ncbi:uncharacterized protein METZ01_LOCUS236945 [marine metagenome]|uniref:Uncharacterized protein n=1 Tax=marine metagenome TaxID=408172 RepID=A0A382HCA3_9ZZZZ